MEAALQGIFRAAPVGIGVSRNRVLARLNDRLCEMVGYSREKLIGKRSRMLYFSEEEYRWVGRALTDLIESQGAGEIETAWRTRDGRRLEVQLRSAPLVPGDLSAGVAFTAMDITDRKRSEKALKESEEQFRRIVETAYEGIWIVDSELRTTFINARMANLLGYRPEEVEDKPFLEYVDPDWRDRVILAPEEGGQDELHQRELLFRKRDGAPLWTILRTQPFRDEDGYLLGTLGMITDITDRKKAEAELRLHDRVFETIHDGVIISDLQGRILDWNAGAEHMFGYSREEALGRRTEFLDLPEEREHLTDRILRALREEGSWLGRKDSLRADGARVACEVLVVPLRDMDGEMIGSIGVNRDITERQRVMTTLESIFRASPAGIGTIQSRVLTNVNQRFCEIVGYPREELLGRDIRMLYFDQNRYEHVGRELYAQLEKEGTGNLETRWMRKDGREIDVLGRITSLDPGNPDAGESFVVLDITERKRAERALQQSERFLANVLDSIQDGISILDRDLTIRRVNWVMKQWYRENVPLEGKKCFACYHNADRACDPCPTLRCFESGQTEKEIVPGLPGSPVQWIELYSFPIKDQQTREVTGVVEYVRDITDRRQAEITAQRSAAILKSIFHASPAGAGLISNRVLREFNDHFCELIGYEREEMMDRDVRFLYPDQEQYERVGREVYAQIRETGTGSIETRWRRKDGQILDVQISLTALDAEHPEAGQSFVALDITESKTAARERENLIAELEARNAELERFAYTVSHDLKTPLITIRGFLGYLEEDVRSGSTDRMEDDLSRINQAAERMLQLLDELLELSRIGRIVNPPEWVPFDRLAREAVQSLGSLLEDKHIQVEIAPDLPEVYGDATRLCEVLENLLSNAAKFMGDQPKPRIKIGHLSPQEGSPIFTVQDNGLGIEPAYREKIFRLFEKLDAGSQGTGIGLAIVQRIIEFHGGRIWVESEGPGKGSTFCFTLPPPAE